MVVKLKGILWVVFGNRRVKCLKEFAGQKAPTVVRGDYQGQSQQIQQIGFLLPSQDIDTWWPPENILSENLVDARDEVEKLPLLSMVLIALTLLGTWAPWLLGCLVLGCMHCLEGSLTSQGTWHGHIERTGFVFSKKSGRCI